jgi:16S rRNA (guanine527-N7)-methyltransferase
MSEADLADIAGRPVSRETSDKLEAYAAELIRWQRIKNLVSPADLAVLRTRHILDSLQLVALQTGPTWTDLGSGAGLPGLVVAIACPETEMHLVESNGRKCAFLRHIARTLAPNVVVREGRIEAQLSHLPEDVAQVSARALAPLDQLIRWSATLLRKGAIGVFPKGKDVESELTLARQSWRFETDLLPSRTDPNARIVRIHHFDGPRA